MILLFVLGVDDRRVILRQSGLNVFVRGIEFFIDLHATLRIREEGISIDMHTHERDVVAQSRHVLQAGHRAFAETSRDLGLHGLELSVDDNDRRDHGDHDEGEGYGQLEQDRPIPEREAHVGQIDAHGPELSYSPASPREEFDNSHEIVLIDRFDRL